MGKEFSGYQKKVIKDYYENLDKISLSKLQELVGKIYLEQDPAKKEKLWKQVEAALTKFKIPPAIVQHILQKRDVVILAKNLNDWSR
ncbi:MAG: hypothetical protein ABSE89_08795 [Sedimentisphaerales bacterium]